MKSLETWLSEYSFSHKNPINKKIHYICVPLIMWSILGLFWSIPVGNNLLNVASVFSLVCLVFYFRLDRLMSCVMALFISFMLFLCFWLQAESAKLLEVSIIVFVFSWAGQFIGHKIEGKKPSFFQDVQFLLIGPLWIVRPIVRKLF